MTVSLERSQVDALVARFAPGALVRSVSRLEGGVSSLMARVDLEGQGTCPSRVTIRRMGPYALRHDPGSLRRELAVLLGVHKAGLPVPSVVFADVVGAVVGEPLLVLEYIEGDVASAVADSPAFAREVAEAMAAIHRVEADSWGLPDPTPLSAREPGGDCPVLVAAYRALSPHLGALPPCPALLHGDLWPGNMVAREGHLVGILDWEDARLGDPLLDIAITRLDLMWLYGEPAVEAFTERMVEQRAFTPQELARADLYAALRPGTALQHWASAYPTIGRPDVTFATMSAVQNRFAADALNRL